MTTLTDRELYYMVFCCLQESGYQHSALMFGYEAGIGKETIDASSVPPGALISFIHKGIEMEANLKTDDAEPVNADELKHVIEEKWILRAAKELENLSKGKEIEDTDTAVKDDKKEKNHENINYKLKETVTVGGHKPTNMPTSSTPRPHGVRSTDVLRLEGHSAEVFDCAWSPAGLVLASGSGDSTARIWSIADRTNSTSSINRISSVRVLQHFVGKTKGETSAITKLDWNMDGRLLATGSQNGLARIWDIYGGMSFFLIKHTGPVYCISWNKKDNHLLTGAYDRTAIVWDTNTYNLKQQLMFHSGPVLDVDWRTNRTFASGSTDKMIYICKIGEDQPVKRFSGHKYEVNCVKWDPTCLLLASGSEDKTVKVWSMEHDKPIHDFKDHNKAIYTVKWSPTGPTTNNPNKQLLLASGSHDSTVKLWDVESGGLHDSLNGHRNEVLCLSFSPDGEYLASGSGDKRVNIWSIKDGKIVKTYFGKGSISQVSWSREGYKIAYATSNNNLYVSDFRK